MQSRFLFNFISCMLGTKYCSLFSSPIDTLPTKYHRCFISFTTRLRLSFCNSVDRATEKLHMESVTTVTTARTSTFVKIAMNLLSRAFGLSGTPDLLTIRAIGSLRWTWRNLQNRRKAEKKEPSLSSFISSYLSIARRAKGNHTALRTTAIACAASSHTSRLARSPTERVVKFVPVLLLCSLCTPASVL